MAPFGRGAVDVEALLAWTRELFSVAGLVEELDLDTRIWSKPARQPAAARA